MIVLLVLIVPVALALFILWMERLESVVLNQPAAGRAAGEDPE